MKLTEKNIQWLIYKDRRFQDCFPNIHTERWGGSEADVIYLTASQRVWMYEIKIVKSDFLADLKKERHKRLMNRDFNKMIIKPSRFYYVTHGFELCSEEIPDYAGWLTVDGMRLVEQKKAPILWDERMTPESEEFLRKKIYARFSRRMMERGKIDPQRFRDAKKAKNKLN